MVDVPALLPDIVQLLIVIWPEVFAIAPPTKPAEVSAKLLVKALLEIVVAAVVKTAKMAPPAPPWF